MKENAFSVVVADHLEKLSHSTESRNSNVNKLLARMNDLDFRKRTRIFSLNFKESKRLCLQALFRIVLEPFPGTYWNNEKQDRFFSQTLNR